MSDRGAPSPVDRTADPAEHQGTVPLRPERRRRDGLAASHSLILRHVNDAVISIDNRGLVTYLNATAERHYQVRAADAIGRPLQEMYEYRWINPEDEERASHALASDGFWRGENLHVLADGSILHVDSSVSVLKDHTGAPLGLLAVIRDVTAAKRVEEALRERDERMRRVLAIETVGVLFFSLDGRIMDANAAFERMSGYTRDELCGTAHWHVLTAENYLGITRQAAQQLADRGETAPYEKQMIRKDGSRWWGLFAPKRIAGTGPAAECVEFILDITHTKDAEAALREVERRKDEFLAILAHELRNPLAPIRTAVGILRAENVPHALSVRARDIIDRQVTQMARLVDDLLDISRLSRGQMSLQLGRVRLDDVLDLAIETARPLIQDRGHRLTERRGSPGTALVADMARLAQVFANLLNNAAKYTPPGGSIVLDVVEQSGHVEVRVSDTGEGIAADHLDRVFELFAQGGGGRAPSAGGLGIGLALARRLVELHGGTLVAFSAGLGQGAMFRVQLPTVEPVTAAPPEVPAHSIAPLDRRVLVVDDNADAAETAAMLLRAAGCEVRTAYGGERAVQEAGDFRPEVVLLDLGMPGVDGLEACRRIRALPNGAALFVVAVTGWGQEDSRRRTQLAGFDAHLVKPVAPDALVELVRNAPRRER